MTTQKVTHTPGKWRIDTTLAGHIVEAADGTTIALVPPTDRPGELEANAYLLGAAPDLLEALHDLLNSVNGFMDVAEMNGIAARNKSDWALLCTRFDAGYAAIAKARGES